jgi:hypothetical protein
MAKPSTRKIVVLTTVAAAGIAVLATGLGAAWHGYQQHSASEAHARMVSAITCKNLGPTLVTHDNPRHECVGVTDGLYLFAPADSQLTRVEKDIFKANKEATARHDFVSVAYLLPIAQGYQVEPLKTVAEQLEGAYAQVVAYNARKSHPQKIQLLIASNGYGAEAYKTVDQYLENDITSQHLVAVAGIGVSLDTTHQSVVDLTQHSPAIPVFGASITADNFDNVRNMVRVVPSNKDEVTALLNALKPHWKTAYLVDDEKTGDAYSASLFLHFYQGWPDPLHGDKVAGNQSYDSGASGYQYKLGQIATGICDVKPQVVLFAGRATELAPLIQDLHDTCTDVPLNIVTGDDATNLDSTALQTMKGGPLALYYAANATPAEWGKGAPGFDAFSHAFLGATFSPASMDDGNAMMGWDAVLAADTVIRNTRQTTSANVAGGLDLLQNAHTVFGATGTITLPADYRSGHGSNPLNKPVAIMRVAQSGTASFWKIGRPGDTPAT